MKKLILSIFSIAILGLAFTSCDDDDKQISYESLPEVSRTFIETHFPGITARLVEEDNDSYDVYLNNGFEVDFDKQGVWKNIDGNYQQLPASFLALPPINVINDYVQSTYPNQFIIEVDKDLTKNGFEVTLNNNLELIFNWDGTFRAIDVD